MMDRRRSARVGLALVVALGVLGVGAADAGACENGVEFAVDYQTPQIARAEKALKDGKHALAAVGVVQVFPTIKAIKPTHSPLAGRALRIMALVATRTGGAITVGKQWQGSTPEDRRANLLWAVDTLRSLNKMQANKPALETDLAEALSKLDETKAEALSILNRLAGKDLITSAHGYAALAKLRDAAGNKEGSEAAAKKCESMAKDPGICRGPGGPSA